MNIKKLKTKDGEYFYPETSVDGIQGNSTSTNNGNEKPLATMLDNSIGWATTRIIDSKYYLYVFKSKEDYDIWHSCENLTEQQIVASGYSVNEVNNLVMLKIPTGDVAPKTAPSQSEDPEEPEEPNTPSNPTNPNGEIDYKFNLPTNERIGGGGNTFVTGEVIPLSLSKYAWLGGGRITIDIRKEDYNPVYYIAQISYDEKDIEDPTKEWVDLSDHGEWHVTDPDSGVKYTIESSRGNYDLPDNLFEKLGRGETVKLYLRTRTDAAAQAMYKETPMRKVIITINGTFEPNPYYIPWNEQVEIKDRLTFYFNPIYSELRKQDDGGDIIRLAETTDFQPYLRAQSVDSSTNSKLIMNNTDKYILPFHYKGVNCNDGDMRVTFGTTVSAEIQNKFQYYFEGDESTKHTINLHLRNTGGNPIEGDGESNGYSISKEQARNGIHVYIEPRKKADGTYDFPDESGEFTLDHWGNHYMYGYSGSPSTVLYKCMMPNGHFNLAPAFTVGGVNVDTFVLVDSRTWDGQPVDPPYWTGDYHLLFTADSQHTNSTVDDTYASDPHTSYFYLEGSGITNDVGIDTFHTTYKYEYWNGNYTNATTNGSSWKTYTEENDYYSQNHGTLSSELKTLLNTYGKVLFRMTCKILGDTGSPNSEDEIISQKNYLDWNDSGNKETIIYTMGYEKLVIYPIYDKTGDQWVYGLLNSTTNAIPKSYLASNSNNSLYEWLCRRANDLGIKANLGDGYILQQELDKITKFPTGFMQDVQEDSDGNLFTSLTKTALQHLPNLSDIKERAFTNCSNLQTITLPGSVRRIADDAFKNCHQDLELNANDPSIIDTSYSITEINI